MAARADYHHAFAAKVDAAASVAKALGWIVNQSRPQLARHLGISQNTLKSACSTGRVSGEVAAAFASAFDFDVNEPWWYDPSRPEDEKQSVVASYTGRDTVGAFHANLCHIHGLGMPSSRVQATAPALKLPLMASFGIDDANQAAFIDAPSSLFASILLRPAMESGVRYGFSTVMLRILFEPKSKARVANRLGKPSVSMNGATFVTEGADQTPHWLLRVGSGLLKGEFLTSNAPLGQLTGAAIGTKFKAELLVNPHDGEIAFEGDQDQILGIKPQILMALMAERLPEAKAEDEGWITLGIQELQLVRADSAV